MTDTQPTHVDALVVALLQVALGAANGAVTPALQVFQVARRGAGHRRASLAVVGDALRLRMRTNAGKHFYVDDQRGAHAPTLASSHRFSISCHPAGDLC